uniref:Polymerase nucleotidyl transferase domain-containing protein n=1 Tax=Rhizochromulina marina TaxID=1034831 RepID=A0A7S2SJ60_9STRA
MAPKGFPFQTAGEGLQLPAANETALWCGLEDVEMIGEGFGLRGLDEYLQLLAEPIPMAYDGTISPLSDEDADITALNIAERARWQRWVVEAAEVERKRRMAALEEIQREEDAERSARRQWAMQAIAAEHRDRISEQFLVAMTNAGWVSGEFGDENDAYDIVCPYCHLGCPAVFPLRELDVHFKTCSFARQIEQAEEEAMRDQTEEWNQDYEVACPNAVIGCTHSCSRSALNRHLAECPYGGAVSRETELKEREKWWKLVELEAEQERYRRIQEAQLLALDEIEDERVGGRLQADGGRLNGAEPPRGQLAEANQDGGGPERSALDILREMQKSRLGGYHHRRSSLTAAVVAEQIQDTFNALESQIQGFATECDEFERVKKPSCERILERLQTVVKTLWPNGTAHAYGSFKTRLLGRRSDLDVVVCWDMTTGDYETSLGVGVRTMSPCYCVQRLAAHLRSERDWIRVKKVLDRGRVPIIKAVGYDGDEEIEVDLSMHSQSHTGITSTAFVSELVASLPPLRPLTLVLKELVAQHQLDDPYLGGISSYALVLMVSYFLFQRRRTVTVAATTRPTDPAPLPGDTRTVPLPTHGDWFQVAKDSLPFESAARITPSILSSPSTTLSFNASNVRGSDPNRVAPCFVPPAHSDQLHSGTDEAPSRLPARRRTSVTRSLPDRSWVREPAADLEPPPPVAEAGHREPGAAAAPAAREPADPDHLTRQPQPPSTPPLVPPLRREISSPSPTTTSSPVQSYSHAHSVSVGRRKAHVVLLRGLSSNVVTDAVRHPSLGHIARRIPNLSLPRRAPASGSPGSPGRTSSMSPSGYRLTSPPGSPLLEPHSPQASSSAATSASQQKAEGDARAAPAAGREDDATSAFRQRSTSLDAVPRRVRAAAPLPRENLGELLVDFLRFWGSEFKAGDEGFSVRHGGFRFSLFGTLPHPQASDPVVIEDPINVITNVGRTCYKFTQLQRLFASAHSRLRDGLLRNPRPRTTPTPPTPPMGQDASQPTSPSLRAGSPDAVCADPVLVAPGVLDGKPLELGTGGGGVGDRDARVPDAQAAPAPAPSTVPSLLQSILSSHTLLCTEDGEGEGE